MPVNEKHNVTTILDFTFQGPGAWANTGMEGRKLVYLQ